ncbi:MAG: Rne/Rng family ribonuclease [Phycisphaerae bacterium]|nr:Rne/Rng family ribonuclease [Phycisphaerae bacterium]
MAESQMLINYVPGEECRVAIVEDGKLEELFVERFATASRVSNIYVGKVMNVEPAIQAAFVDFGVGDNGFLHITDLHPRYFPGEGDDTTERVGLKTPRRERPLIQHALRRGDEVIVQVLKEGVGTKGPTLTSYLSIPGRFLVMMPYMDKVGVSRKVEDEEQRREMRQILDQLDLPEGFGFILRTAGMDQTKTDLKRDLAYLQRLWKDMEKRLKTGGKPRLLYSESDLLVRSLRDLLTSDIQRVVIDNEQAMQRAARFMKIVAPRGTTKLYHYPGKSPIFHAFGIEQQISLIHAREVPLPSGGRLVIDQTEALVAIDVNSGKSRESRDAETNAYQTNIEAVDEICRQLRLRDMGGIVINDLIDMRRHEHRKDIENRFKERLKRDRAKTTVLSITEFGILEMTRQRMRPSHESTHFTDCPTCRGRGLVQKPDSIAADALRDLAAVLDVEKVFKVEMAVAPRVAGELLSHKRQLLGRIERHYGKHVDVRVSEAVAIDRISFYAYDEQGADIDLTNLPKPRIPKELKEWEDEKKSENDWTGNPDEERQAVLEAEAAAEAGKDTEAIELHPIEIDEADIIPEDHPPPREESSGESEQGEGGRGRRRRRRRGRGREEEGDENRAKQQQPVSNRVRSANPESRQSRQVPAESQATGEGQPGEGGKRRRRRRGRGRGGDRPPTPSPAMDTTNAEPEGVSDGIDSPSPDVISLLGDLLSGPPVRTPRHKGQPQTPRSTAPDLDLLGDLLGDLTGNERRAEGLPSEPSAPGEDDPNAPSPEFPEDDRDVVPSTQFSIHDDRSENHNNIHAGNPDDVSLIEAEIGDRDNHPAEVRPGGGSNVDGQGNGQTRGGRRRRRRGRGGKDGGGPRDAQARGSQPRGEGERPREGHTNRRDDHGQGKRGGERRRDDRGAEGRRDDGRREPRADPGDRRDAPPPPPASSPAPSVPRPRTLYGAARRKLSASELNKRPKSE